MISLQTMIAKILKISERNSSFPDLCDKNGEEIKAGINSLCVKVHRQVLQGIGAHYERENSQGQNP